jgi:hypothetical protein
MMTVSTSSGETPPLTSDSATVWVYNRSEPHGLDELLAERGVSLEVSLYT